MTDDVEQRVALLMMPRIAGRVDKAEDDVLSKPLEERIKILEDKVKLLLRMAEDC